jgi:hypothetical protein
MTKSWATLLFRWVATPVLIVACLTAGVLFLDLLGHWQGEATRLDSPQPTDTSNRYAEKVSTYSLVRLGVLERKKRLDDNVAANIAPLEVNPGAKLFSCLGQIRYADTNLFIDVTALTISIIAIENYNRSYFRRTVETRWQDMMHAFGAQADYTIGIAQIKTSVARHLYLTKVNAAASDQQIKNATRSDCGSAYLASLLVVSFLDECKSAVAAVADLDRLFKCVIQKYTGLGENNRLLYIYWDAVLSSYETLFDRTNEFYRREFRAQLGIQDIKAGVCVEFNPRSPQIRDEPKPRSSDGTEEEQENFRMDRATPLEFARPDAKSSTSLVKIIHITETPRRKTDDITPAILLRQRQDALVQYACKKYGARTVDLYPAMRIIPNSLRPYCGDQFEPGAYMILAVAGESGLGGATSRQCPSVAPPARPGQPKTQPPPRR